MKKRTEKKLKLSTETLRHLNASELQGAAGGAISGSGCSLVSDCHCTTKAC